MIRRSPLLLVLALAVAACDPVTEPQVVPLGEPFWLDYGETAILPSAPTTVRFVDVMEDSRCPSGPLIQCVSAGRVRIRLAIAPAMGDEGMHEVRLLDQPSAAHLGTFVVQLQAVEPQAGAEAPPVSSYRVQLLVTAVR